MDRDFGRCFSWGALKIMGVGVQIEGVENLYLDRPCIYIANHQSAVDLITFGPVYPSETILIGKKELKWIPFFGVFFIAGGNILLDRKRRNKAFAGISHAVEVIQKRKVSIWIFPEGTRNPDGMTLLPFKRGAFYMAIRAQVPIVPIVSAPIRPLIDLKLRKAKEGVLKMKVLPPVKVDGLGDEDAEELAGKVRNQMLEAIHGLVTENSVHHP